MEFCSLFCKNKNTIKQKKGLQVYRLYDLYYLFSLYNNMYKFFYTFAYFKCAWQLLLCTDKSPYNGRFNCAKV